MILFDTLLLEPEPLLIQDAALRIKALVCYYKDV